jgi:predicted nucleic acid-binding Zn ribbon protein
VVPSEGPEPSRTMSDASTTPVDGPSPERSAPVGSPQPVCAICGGPRDLGKREACSDRCRAALCRQRRAQAQATRDGELRATLTAIRKLVRPSLRRRT